MRFRILAFMILAAFTAAGQHNHYIYIQSDNAQLFYIRKGGEVLSSSASGFIILPRLQPGQQELSVGFPKNEFPEYQFTIEIKGKDRGFALKNFSEKGWGLFDLQSLEVIMGKKLEPKKDEQKTELGQLTNDPFSVILASAVDDPRIRQTSLVYHGETVAGSSQVKSAPANQTPAQTTDVTKSSSSTGKELPQEDAAKKSVAVTTAEPPKVSETKTDQPKGAETKTEQPKVAETKPETPKGAETKTEPLKKEETAKSGPTRKEPPKTPPLSSESASKPTAPPEDHDVSVNETRAAGNSANKPEQKKSGLIIKNPFARKKTAPAPTEAGVVTATGAAAKDKDSAKADVATSDQQAANKSKDSATRNGNSQEPKRSYVVKFSEYKSGSEVMMVYIDHQPSYTDTIRLSITEDSAVKLDVLTEKDTLTKANVPPAVVAEKPAQGNTEPTVKKENQTKTKTDTSVGVKPDSSSVMKKAAPSTSPHVSETRSDCRKMATEKDMVAMRKKMIMMADEDEMIALALKDFKTRCYSTERIQNLSYVFTTDKGRYKLFDAAFPYVYDPANYSQLERLLNEDYYIKRFRALVNKN